MYYKNKSLHICNSKIGDIVLNDNEEFQENEKNPIKLKFKNVKESSQNLDCLIFILQKALDNEFNTPATEEIISYTYLMQEHLEKHNKLLDEFFNLLSLPDSKAKLISLSYTKFKD